MRYDVGAMIETIQNIRHKQDEIYGNLDRFTVNCIMAYVAGKPAELDEIVSLQRKITPNIGTSDVVSLLDDLIDQGYVKKAGANLYETTGLAIKTLNREGITKSLVFGN